MSVEERPRDSASAQASAGTSAGGAGGSRRPSRHALLAALFTLYLVLLAWLVLFKLELASFGTGGLRQVKLVPFIADACNGASAPSEVIANVLIFVPFGLYLGLLAPAWPWWRVVATVAGASIALEVAQYVLAVGSSDITDVITNTAGGLLGLGLLVLVRRRLGVRTELVMARVCSVFTVLALLLTVIFVASPLSYGPQPDVRVPTRGAPGAGGDASVAGLPDRVSRAQQCLAGSFSAF